MCFRIYGDRISFTNLILHCTHKILHAPRITGNGNRSQHLYHCMHPRHGDILRIHNQKIPLGVIGNAWYKGIRKGLCVVSIDKVSLIAIFLKLLSPHILQSEFDFLIQNLYRHAKDILSHQGRKIPQFSMAVTIVFIYHPRRNLRLGKLII